MSSLFDASVVVHDIPGIIIMSHGPLAVAVVETLRMVTGAVTNIAAFSLEEGESTEQYTKEVSAAIEAFPEGSIIFTDIMGGTPSNTVILYSREKKRLLYCIAGFNIPLILEALNIRTLYSGKKLLEKILEVDGGGIFNITEFLSAHI